VRLLLQTEWLVEKMLWLLFAYISLVPYYYMQEQRLTGDVPVFSVVKYFPFVLAVLALGLWLSEWARGKRRLVSSPVFVYMGLFLGVSLLSLWGAEYDRKGLVKWVYYNATGCGLTFLVIQYGQVFARRLAICMAGISGFMVFYTFGVALIGEDLVWGAVQEAFNPYYTQVRVSGPFGHTVATATYAMFFFPLALWAWFTLQRSAFRVAWGLVCALYIPVVLLTQTRGALVAVFISIVLMAPWLKRALVVFARIDRKRWLIGLGIGVIVFLVLGKGLEFDQWAGERLAQVGKRWSHIFGPRSVTIIDKDKTYEYNSPLEYTERFRVAQYHTVGNILDEHPFLGVGFGTYTLSFSQYKYTENYMEREFPEHTTENMYLMALAETGWIGLMSRVLLMGGMMILAFRAYCSARSGVQRHLLLAYLAAAGGLAFNMLTWDILNEPTLRMSYWMFSGLALAYCRAEGNTAA
jgi:O-antigen ligase